MKVLFKQSAMRGAGRNRLGFSLRSATVAAGLMAAAGLVALPTATAADVYYDVDPFTAAIDGGTATWSTSNWKTSQAGTTGGSWTANDTAIFDPIIGSPTTTAITLGGPETATAVTFNGAGYTLTGGTLSLAGTGASNWINVNADATIESELTEMRFKGTGEMTISGGGTISTRGVVGDGASGLVTVRQTGGTYDLQEWFMVGGNNVPDSQGAYIMDDGSLTIANGIYLGWGGAGRTGSFTQNGGTVTTVDEQQAIQLGIAGGTGTYTLNGGTLVSNFGRNSSGASYAGSFTFGGGTFRAAHPFDTNRQSAVVTSIADGATARIDTNGQNVTWSTELTGPAANGLVKSGLGVLTLNGNFAGDVTVELGILKASSATSLGSGTISTTWGGGSGTNSGGVDLNGLSFTNPLALGRKAAGPGATGTLQNTNTTTTSVLDGTVSIGGENYVGGDGNVTLNGVVSGGQSTIYSLYKQGAGTWTFANEANTFDGFYYQIGGVTEVTKLANAGETSSLGQVSAGQNRFSFGFNGSGGGTLRYIGSAASSTDRSFELNGTSAVIDVSGTVAGADLDITGVVSGGGGLTKDGVRTLTLSGTNTYTGTTAVDAGTLLIDGDNSAASGNVTVAAGATLGGTGTVGGATTISGTHSPGGSPGLQTFTSGLSYDSTSTLVWELSANTALTADRGTLYDGIDLTTAGALAIDASATLDLVFNQPLADSTPSVVDWSDGFWGSDQQWVIADVSSPVTWDGTVFGTLSVGLDSLGASLVSVRPNAVFSLANSGGDLVLNYASVPEPGTLAVAGLAAAAMLTFRCGRRKKNQC